MGLEYDPDTGLLAYRRVVVTVPRQTGKTTLVLAWELDRCIHTDEWGGPQRVAYSAQTGWDARRKLIDDQVPILEESPLFGFVHRVLRGTGNESVVFKSRSRIDLISGDKGAGHGRTLDLGAVDEAFDDVDDRREGAMSPAMKTRRNAQLLITSTAGTDESLYLQRIVRMGRSAVEDGKTDGVAYFEWSVPKEDDADYDGQDIYDPEVWKRFIPALNDTALATMLAEAEGMSESEFRRAYLNQWTTMETDRVIPAESWEAVCRKDARPAAPLRMGLDVMPERDAGSIVMCGGGVGELVETFDDVSRMEARARELSRKYRASVVIDGNGPAASIADELENGSPKVRVERLTTPQYAVACAKFFDAVIDGNIRVRRSNPMDRAAAGARKKPQGDRFVWSRTSSTIDVTPLVALTLAFGAPKRAGGPLVATT